MHFVAGWLRLVSRGVPTGTFPGASSGRLGGRDHARDDVRAVPRVAVGSRHRKSPRHLVESGSPKYTRRPVPAGDLSGDACVEHARVCVVGLGTRRLDLGLDERLLLRRAVRDGVRAGLTHLDRLALQTLGAVHLKTPNEG